MKTIRIASVGMILALAAFASGYLGPAQAIEKSHPQYTYLLFPFVSDDVGTNTGISIANTSADPLGTPNQSGTCTLTFYGTGAPGPYTTGTIAAGASAPLLLSNIDPGYGAGGFQGYAIAICNFAYAHAYAQLTTTGGGSPFSGYLALVIQPRRLNDETLGN